MIDEMLQETFFRFLLSDKVNEWKQIGDELSDVVEMKDLLTKLHFFENVWDLQEMVFSIFESSGDSNKMVLDFTRFRHSVSTSFQPSRRGDPRRP